MIRAIILDDEVKGSTLLQHKLKNFSDRVCVEAIFNDPQEALKHIRDYTVDVLFLDVEMPLMNGFQFLEQLGQFDFEVIFVTAYNMYTLDALRADALDYLLKPVDPEELAKALDKLEKRVSAKAKLALSELPAVGASSQRIALPTAEGIHLIKKDEILRVEAMSNYSVFYVMNLSKIIVSKTLKEFEQQLEGSTFMRVNRSVIVNLDYVIKYRKGDGGTLELLDGAEIEVSPMKKIQLLERLFAS
ncbi:response regulator transcription factor [Parapedobacter sp. SGR-10]|uniref:LytR/AlgR family response regulator transcription factor n=1 Tax=Parapedobacter sp. SGR-10 TaxID=2710879 RepID=UPI0013D6F51A|nr:LytTR family DNA-binding domain-containing protein [Parapedobacter sp. SGR-10]NGF57530.1 response regulator transcription factor [Parapedobacter sp. SGR-10]